MTAESGDYDPRYLAGILFFNQQDYFEAHEVWEDLWGGTAGPDRRFYQGLIQAAVALFHFGNGNVRGAHRLYHSAEGYMRPFLPVSQGLDVEQFWEQMRKCCAEIVSGPEPPANARPREELLPTIRLDPEPAAWPDPRAYVQEDGEHQP